jgi:hypothetical protein
MQILLELRLSGLQGEAAELAGDVGAVGRMIVGSSKQATGENSGLQIDLKGVLYNASVLQLAGTAMVLNVGTSEVKVTGRALIFVAQTEVCACHLVFLVWDFQEAVEELNSRALLTPAAGRGSYA